MNRAFDSDEKSGYRFALAGVKLFLRLLILVFAVLAIIYVGKKLYALGYEAFSAKPAAENESESTEVTVVITKNMELKDIADLLNEKGLIDESEEAFLIQANAYGYADSIVPGPYVLNTSMTVEEILSTLSPVEEEDDE